MSRFSSTGSGGGGGGGRGGSQQPSWTSPWATGRWQPPIAQQQHQQQQLQQLNSRAASRESSYRSATQGPDAYFRTPSAHSDARRYDGGRDADRERMPPPPGVPASSGSSSAMPGDRADPAAPTPTPERPPWQNELDSIAEALKNRSANFLSIQAVPWDHNPKEIIEFGWSYPDPSRPHAPLEEALITMHYIPNEGYKRRNGMLSQSHREYFLFGDHSLDLSNDSTEWDANKTQRVPLEEVVFRLEQTVRKLVDNKQPLYIIVHGSTRGLNALFEAAVNTSEWADSAFGTISEDDYEALDMNMGLADLNALHQAIRLAKDREKAERFQKEQEETMRRAKYPGDYDDRDDRRDRPYQRSSRFSGRESQGSGAESSDWRRRDQGSSSYNNNNNNNNSGGSRFKNTYQSNSRGSQSSKNNNNNNNNIRGGPSSGKNSSRRKGKNRDPYGDGFDEWGQPLSEDEDQSDDEGFGLGKLFGNNVGTFKVSKQDAKILVIDTVTLCKCLGKRWYEEDLNPNAKEPEDPTVKEMAKAILLKDSPFFKNLANSRPVFDNAGNDAHYTMLALAEMLRDWVEKHHQRDIAADAVPDLIRTGHGLSNDRQRNDRFNADASKLDVGTPAPLPPAPTPKPATKRENENADGDAKQKKKKKVQNVNSSLETLIAEYECLRSVWAAAQRGERTIVWVAVDIETYEHNHNYTIEIGWSILYPQSKFEFDLTGAREEIIASHFIVDENRSVSNGHYVRNNRDHFLLGSDSSEKIEGYEQLMNKTCVASEPRVWDKLHKKIKKFHKHDVEVYLVFHDATGDMKVMDQWEVFQGLDVIPFFDPQTGQHSVPSYSAPTLAGRKPQTVYTVDTQRLMRAYQHSAQTASIKIMCEELVLHPTLSEKRLHNAGNDAFYTLFAMKVMASGPELSELRRIKQEERKRLPRTADAHVKLTSWDQDFLEHAPAKPEPVVNPAQALRPEISTIPGSQERMKPLFELSDHWHDHTCALIAIRSVVVEEQLVELAWSVIDRRTMGFQPGSQPSADAVVQPQRTTHCMDMANVSLLSKAGHRFYKPFGLMQTEDDRDIVMADGSGAHLLPNGTIATSQKRMARQLRAVIHKLRQTPGTLYFVFHGPVANTAMPKLGIPNEYLPPDLQDGRPPNPDDQNAAELLEDDKYARIEISDSALLFERFVEKVESLSNVDCVLIEGTEPQLSDLVSEFKLYGEDEKVVTENVGNAAHIILRAMEYMATCKAEFHAKNGQGAPEPTTQDKLARLRAINF